MLVTKDCWGEDFKERPPPKRYDNLRVGKVAVELPRWGPTVS